ncbi:Grap2 and cyclin-D-interacting-domain-containing protein [Phlyctochytrium arcticum]|nr:Grap2 and cyclin-D-interacting-domain-containing protein [Phlyctochytrium arcticum]
MTNQQPNDAEIKQNLDALIEQALQYVEELQNLQDLSSVSAQAFDEKWFKTELARGAKNLAHNATKLALLAPAKSKDTPGICKEMQKCIMHIVATVQSIPVTLGATFQDEIRSTTRSLLTDVANLANSFLTPPRVFTNGRQIDYLSSTGLVWKACEIVEEMSLSNSAAVAKVLRTRVTLLDDALRELQETLEDGDCNDGGWDGLLSEEEGGDDEESHQMTDGEKDLLTKCITFVRAIKLLLRKTTSSLKSISVVDTAGGSIDFERIQMMDELARLSDTCSRGVDDLVGSADVPISFGEVANMASVLAQSCNEMLELAKTLFEEESTLKWFETCGSQLQKVLEQILEKHSAR